MGTPHRIPSLCQQASAGRPPTFTVTLYPQSSDTPYANTNGTGAAETSYVNTYYANSAQVQSVITTLPVVGNGQNGQPQQNGSGTAAQTTDVYNEQGQLVWSMDADGYITYNQYDAITGDMTEEIQDAELPPLLTGGSYDLTSQYASSMPQKVAQQTTLRC